MKPNPLAALLVAIPYALLLIMLTLWLGTAAANGRFPKPYRDGDSIPDVLEPLTPVAIAFFDLYLFSLACGIGAILLCINRDLRPHLRIFCKFYWPGALLLVAILTMDPMEAISWFSD